MKNFTGANSWRNYLVDRGEDGKTILLFVSHFLCSPCNAFIYPVFFFYLLELLITVITYYNYQLIYRQTNTM
jgi:hypothetical protein